MVNRSVNDFSVSYTTKDVSLYALSIGFGSTMQDYEHDLRFVDEEHPEFTVVPTFCLALIFWTQNNGSVGNSSTMPPFPPPMMKAMGVLPKRFLHGDVSLGDYPVVHTSQSISFHREMPVPQFNKVMTTLRGKFLAVAPKSVGTFVTTEAEIYENSWLVRSNLLCTVRSTMVILGLPTAQVLPFTDPYSEPTYFAFHGEKQFLFEVNCEVAPNTALLYRLASGDSNRIHVDPFAVPLLGGVDSDSGIGSRPLLHGLCTLGIATRIILQYMIRQQNDLSVRYLEGKFVKPVFVNDLITVQAWKLIDLHDDIIRVHFITRKTNTEEVLLDNGRMLLVSKKDFETKQSRL